MEIQPTNLEVKLYNHQIASVKNMEQLERNKRFTAGDKFTCETEFGILGDIPGYGKSYSIIALLLRDKMEWDLDQEHLSNDITIMNNSVRMISSFPLKRIKSNLIVCSISLMDQWLHYLGKAPSLSVFQISNRKNIHDFKVGEHDVVLVSTTRYNEVMDIVGHKIAWKRFIFDEAASTPIPSMRSTNFGFMWLVTATYESLYSIRGNGNNYLRNFMKGIPYHYLHFFVIKNSERFIKESFYMPPVQTIVHQCINPRILSILRAHIDEETHTMISAGNIKGAISRLGGNIYSATNLIDIVRKKKEEKIVSCKQSVEFWERRDNKKETDHWKDRLKLCEEELRDIEEKYKGMLTEDCSICYEQIRNHTMVSCCQHLFCGNCIMKWLQTTQSCPLCRHQLKPADLSFIGDEEKGDTKMTKKETVIHIIQECVEKNRKVILFSSYDETLDIIRSDLDEHKIDFAELCGQRSVRESKLEKFTNGELCVIFLNSRFNGAGINLEVADEIILYHNMSDALKKQVLGRALRIGRKDGLIVHEFEN